MIIVKAHKMPDEEEYRLVAYGEMYQIHYVDNGRVIQKRNYNSKDEAYLDFRKLTGK